jgi:hypothetical protein
MQKTKLVTAILAGLILLSLPFLPQIIPAEKQKDNATVCQSNQVDVIIYTATQDWPPISWVYILSMDGTVLFFHTYYDMYLFNDVEVVDNEVYVADWIAPRLYKVNISTGDLTVVIDDWSLYSMYDVAYDGSFFYINEWNLNRYTLDGVKDGYISFNFNVRGGAWDQTHYWTLLNTSEIKCWDITAWPTINEVPENSFFAPTSACRGLWHDGTSFWTAERNEGGNGYIYQFDNNGTIINQIPEPLCKGYAACVIKVPNTPPYKPDTPQGPHEGDIDFSYIFTTSTSDPENHEIYYQWDWGEGQTTSWIGPYQSGESVEQSHSWQEPGVYTIKVRAKDMYGSESSWSEIHAIIIGNLPPEIPVITGPNQGKSGVTYLYQTSTIDPEHDEVYYFWDYGDNTTSGWLGPYPSAMNISTAYSWEEEGTYIIRVKAKDTNNSESDWGVLEVKMPVDIPIQFPKFFNNYFKSIINFIKK